jgi:hypothetical protein
MIGKGTKPRIPDKFRPNTWGRVYVDCYRHYGDSGHRCGRYPLAWAGTLVLGASLDPWITRNWRRRCVGVGVGFVGTAFSAASISSLIDHTWSVTRPISAK